MCIRDRAGVTVAVSVSDLLEFSRSVSLSRVIFSTGVELSLSSPPQAVTNVEMCIRDRADCQL